MLIPIKKQYFNFSEQGFWEFCRELDQFHIERDSHGTILIQEPTGSYGGNFNGEVSAKLFNWSHIDRSGIAFDSSTGFTLPNKAIRSPDASWISNIRWKEVPEEQRYQFAPICPDFVIEISSPSDKLDDLFQKMQEYIDNGTLLGWLIDPKLKKVWIYRVDQPVEEIDSFSVPLYGEKILPGFQVRLDRFWKGK